MRNHWKLFGKLTGNNVELSCDFSRWLIGFGWMRHNTIKKVQWLSVHINLGPLAMVVTFYETP